MVKSARLGQDFYNAIQEGLVAKDIIERLSPLPNMDEINRPETTTSIYKEIKTEEEETKTE